MAEVQRATVWQLLWRVALRAMGRRELARQGSIILTVLRMGGLFRVLRQVLAVEVRIGVLGLRGMPNLGSAGCNEIRTTTCRVLR